MKNLNYCEIHSIVEMLNETLAHAQLQDVILIDDIFSFGFYHSGKVHWLILDLDQVFPFIGPSQMPFTSGPKTIKPMSLFLNSHFKNHKVQEIRMPTENERIVEIFFSDHGQKTSQKMIQFRLIPRAVNLMASANGKTISWNQVKPLAERKESTYDLNQAEVRSIPSLFKFWSQFNRGEIESQKSNKSLSSYDVWVKQRNKDIEKKNKALVQLEKQVASVEFHLFQNIGEHLKTFGYKNLDLEWPKIIDLKLSISKNIELCFQKAKLMQTKAVGAQARILVLKKELELLSDSSHEAFADDLETRKRKSELKLASAKKTSQSAQTRKKIIDEDLQVYCLVGKSAADNVKLLKIAKPWSIWLHLKDYPGAYCIIFFERNLKLKDQQIIEAAKWLVQESVAGKKDWKGIKLNIVYTECRFLTLLKGDRLGRVTYSSAKELVISV